jgi:hypothetical protein
MMRPLHKNVRFPDVADEQSAVYNLRRKRKRYNDVPFVSLDRDTDLLVHANKIRWIHFLPTHKRYLPGHLAAEKNAFTARTSHKTKPTLFLANGNHATFMDSQIWVFLPHDPVAFFAYDYAAMRTAMQPFRHELLAYLMHPLRMKRIGHFAAN